MKLLPLLLWYVIAVKADAFHPDLEACPREDDHHNAQHSLDLDKLMGKWYAVEIIHHRDDGRYTSPGRKEVRSCPELTLSWLRLYDTLRLHWSEPSGDIQYTLHVPNVSAPGYWLTSGAQNGSMIRAVESYRQFAGTVEVAKAVASHMVLTFCAPGSELYSVVMSRNPRLPRLELAGVNKMLENRGLSTYFVKEACKDAGTLQTLSLFTFVLTVFIVIKNLCS